MDKFQISRKATSMIFWRHEALAFCRRKPRICVFAPVPHERPRTRRGRGITEAAPRRAGHVSASRLSCSTTNRWCTEVRPSGRMGSLKPESANVRSYAAAWACLSEVQVSRWRSLTDRIAACSPSSRLFRPSIRCVCFLGWPWLAIMRALAASAAKLLLEFDRFATGQLAKAKMTRLLP